MVMGNTAECKVAIIGAGPYGLAAFAFLSKAGIEARIFGEPMSFWEHMPRGMCLRSSWSASSIGDPAQEFNLDAFCRENGNHCPKPIPLDRFVAYGHWFQNRVAPQVDRRMVHNIEANGKGFILSLSDAQTLTARRVVVAAGINTFARRPREFDGIPATLATHSSEHRNFDRFKGQSAAVIGAGQSALESAALCREAGVEVEVIARTPQLNWVGLHPRLHHLGFISRMLYSDRDVGPAGISRLVAAPHVFRRFPRKFQDRTAYRAIRPAVAGWLAPRLTDMNISLGRRVVSAAAAGSQLRLKLDDGSERLVDHALLATGYQVDIARYGFLSQELATRIKTVGGFPVLRRGFESSVPGLHFLGKPAARSFGPILGFVSGTDFAGIELVRTLKRSQ